MPRLRPRSSALPVLPSPLKDKVQILDIQACLVALNYILCIYTFVFWVMNSVWQGHILFICLRAWHRAITQQPHNALWLSEETAQLLQPHFSLFFPCIRYSSLLNIPPASFLLLGCVLCMEYFPFPTGTILFLLPPPLRRLFQHSFLTNSQISPASQVSQCTKLISYLTTEKSPEIIKKEKNMSPPVELQALSIFLQNLQFILSRLLGLDVGETHATNRKTSQAPVTENTCYLRERLQTLGF